MNRLQQENEFVIQHETQQKVGSKSGFRRRRYQPKLKDLVQQELNFQEHKAGQLESLIKAHIDEWNIQQPATPENSYGPYTLAEQNKSRLSIVIDKILAEKQSRYQLDMKEYTKVTLRQLLQYTDYQRDKVYIISGFQVTDNWTTKNFVYQLQMSLQKLTYTLKVQSKLSGKHQNNNVFRLQNAVDIILALLEDLNECEDDQNAAMLYQIYSEFCSNYVIYLVESSSERQYQIEQLTFIKE